MKKYKAFTFFEMLIYLAILSMVLGSIILFTWDIIYSRVKINTQQEVVNNLRLAMSKIAYEVRNSTDITVDSPTQITLTTLDSTRDPTVFTLNNNVLQMGWGSDPNCPSTNPCDITSSNVDVSNLVFTDITNPLALSKMLRIEMTIESSADSGRQEWDYSQNYVTSITTR